MPAGCFLNCDRFNENNVPEPLVMPSPVTITVEFIYSDMADRAALLPGVARLDGRKVEVQAADMRVGYRLFQAVVDLARR